MVYRDLIVFVLRDSGRHCCPGRKESPGTNINLENLTSKPTQAMHIVTI
jgi:hypothetical protein